MSDRTELRRKPDRTVADRDAIHAVLDEGLVAHVGLIAGNGDTAHPVVIPMLYARDGNVMYLHGSPASRLLRTAKKGAEVCVTVTLLDALVLARSGLNHSMNYRSVIVMGTATEITDREKKVAALNRFVDHTIPGRSAQIRAAHVAEVKATTVLVLPLNECSMKARTTGVVDEPDDLDEPTWAGLIPLGLAIGEPQPDEGSAGDTVPGHVAFWSRGPGQLNGRPADPERTG
ncbi:MAG: hypothetical protein CL468_07940 [Acidimicrobiaceae bacterium]|nr:hypothetical protein [Acidimicrobiaceae bacterium]|tara:strand:+ start:1729 stop:2421 length:693 start_codon:yes stop_codon:yes gene_type:complete